jgi:hypothetical protein
MRWRALRIRADERSRSFGGRSACLGDMPQCRVLAIFILKLDLRCGIAESKAARNVRRQMATPGPPRILIYKY